MVIYLDGSLRFCGTFPWQSGWISHNNLLGSERGAGVSNCSYLRKEKVELQRVV